MREQIPLTKQQKEIMKEFCAAGGAIFFSSHVLEVVEKLCDRVGIIKQGKLVKEGKPQDILRDESALLEVKLDMPFVYKIEKELKEIGINSNAETIDQLVEDIWASK